MPDAMRSCPIERPAAFNRPVNIHHKVITNVGEATVVHMPAAYVGGSNIAPLGGCRTMHDNLTDFSG